MSDWYRRSYRRNLVDMHVDDWDASFLSRLDPVEYVRLLQRANVRSAMVYANSHVGLCYWPTASGHMHAGIRGRDVFGEIVTRAKRAGLDVVAYYSLIFNNRACENHPDWQIRDVDGRPSRDYPGRLGRYGTVCPNNAGYRAFVEAQVAELLPRYEVDGIFFDMCFWPACCYCDACKERYAREAGADIPTVIDWSDSTWIAFQRAREAWTGEFGLFVRRLAERLRPGISVEHNSSPYTGGWRLATNLELVAANSYIGGDLYGGADEQSFVCKLYETLTPGRPFEFMTSRCYPNLAEHTSSKPQELLEQQVYLALAHQGAFLFIDAIDPDGRLHAPIYETMGQIFRESQRYEEYLGGERVQDVGIYFSFDSKFDPAENRQVAQVNTYGGHPVAAAVALRNIEILEAEHLADRAAETGAYLIDGLRGLMNHQVVGDVRGKGLLIGMELVKDRTTKEPADASQITAVVDFCRERGLIVGRSGGGRRFGNTITLCPPLVITRAECDRIVDTLDQALATL